MQVTVKNKFIHEAPRKLRLVSDSIRGLPADKAVAELATVNKRASRVIRKSIISAIAAARQKGLNMSQLFVGTIMVDEGPKLRRMIPLSRGRSQRIEKKMSHLVISLTDEPVASPSGRAYKSELGAKAKKTIKTAKTVTKAEKVEQTEQPAPATVEMPAVEPVTETPVEATEGSK